MVDLRFFLRKTKRVSIAIQHPCISMITEPRVLGFSSNQFYVLCTSFMLSVHLGVRIIPSISHGSIVILCYPPWRYNIFCFSFFGSSLELSEEIRAATE